MRIYKSPQSQHHSEVALDLEPEQNRRMVPGAALWPPGYNVEAEAYEGFQRIGRVGSWSELAACEMEPLRGMLPGYLPMLRLFHHVAAYGDQYGAEVAGGRCDVLSQGRPRPTLGSSRALQDKAPPVP